MKPFLKNIMLWKLHGLTCMMSELIFVNVIICESKADLTI